MGKLHSDNRFLPCFCTLGHVFLLVPPWQIFLPLSVGNRVNMFSHNYTTFKLCLAMLCIPLRCIIPRVACCCWAVYVPFSTPRWVTPACSRVWARQSLWVCDQPLPPCHCPKWLLASPAWAALPSPPFPPFSGTRNVLCEGERCSRQLLRSEEVAATTSSNMLTFSEYTCVLKPLPASHFDWGPWNFMFHVLRGTKRDLSIPIRWLFIGS